MSDPAESKGIGLVISNSLGNVLTGEGWGQAKAGLESGKA